jgi:hypothetical protein
MKHQLRMDAHVLGMLLRNVPGMGVPNLTLQKNINKIIQTILTRYNAHDALGCLLMLKMQLKNDR